MKLKSFFTAALVAAFSVYAFSNNAKTVESKITKVTVYLNGALVERTLVANMPKGISTIRVNNLSNGIDANSIQANGNGDFTILGVNYKFRKPDSEDYPVEILTWKDSILVIQQKIDFNNNHIAAMDEERKMILVNNKIDYSKLGFAVDDIEDLADFFRSRITELLNIQSEKRAQNQQFEKIKQQLNRKISEANTAWQRQNGEIYVDVLSPGGGAANIGLSYYVSNAGWVPSYNIKSEDISKPIKLAYNAQVYQNTGVDWSNVLITLSTMNPMLNNNKPMVTPWRLDFINPIYLQGQNSYQLDMAKTTRMNSGAAMEMEDQTFSPAGTTANFVQVTDMPTSITFNVSIPYSIPSDGEQHLVNIQNLDLQADFEYYTVPKLAQQAYLIAKISGWEDKNLLPGEANIYLQNAYVGKSYIDPRTVENKLDISFGVDNQVVVTREKIKSYCSTSLLGNNKKEAVGFELKIRNTKKVPIKIVVQDVLPTTGNSEISVTVDDIGDGDLNKDTGIITWKADILPASTKLYPFKFEVKFPKDKHLNL